MRTKSMKCTGLLLVIGICAIAQPNPPNRERMHDKRAEIQSHKIAFITNKLDLTPEEAQVFWPVYNQCQKQQEEFRKKNKEKFRNKNAEGNRPTPIDEMTDKEVEERVDNQIAAKQHELDMQKACLARYKDVLPIKKVAKLYQAERQFKKELLRKLGDKKQMHQQRQPRPPR